jgi:transcription-repair coupling factor (superfamily II helicase)
MIFGPALITQSQKYLVESKQRATGAPRLRTLADLPAMVDATAEMAAHLKGWKPGHVVAFDGVFGTVRALLAATLTRHFSNVLVLVPQAVDADIVSGDCIAMGVAESISLPLSATDGTPDSIRDADYAERLQVLQRLRGRRADDPMPLVVTAYVGAAMQLVPTPGAVANATRQLRVGERLDDVAFRKWLAEAGFHATTAVQLPGEFSQRGGILDIYSPDQPSPIRVELFDDEIESIRRFDPASQRSIEPLPSVEIAAVGGGRDAMGPFADYLPADTAVLIVDPGECKKSAASLLARIADTSQFIDFESLVQSFGGHRIATAATLGEATGDAMIDLRATTVESFVGAIDQTRARVDSIAVEHDVFVVGDTPADGERLTELLADTDAARSGRLHLVVAGLSGGFRLIDAGVLVLTGAELFHRSPIRRGKSRSRGKPIDSLTQLEAGDLVVHLSYGIGLYRGLKHIEKNGQQQEHLAIEFDEGTTIYVPASRIGLVQRYVGGGSSRPRLAKVGGQAWAKTRKAVEAAVTDMASELLEIQASRASKIGIAFDPDNHWQHQFDASFPYVPTRDQVLAIDACKDDMERPRPMDRLICGDVGFGKTEVAMRAAFKAVVSGYQVAVLVPTTVLAEQHYHSFMQRMAEFPVDIAKLSRFATAAEQKETVKQLRSGKIDIVVGTHRLASKDVDFSNLGLVIVDEEQRFGVEVKERLKSLHRNVDVLTLSATPIPRTLHMALVGVRDISNLETPPEERMAVETRVGRWSDKVVRSAIVRELNRGGQIYFVHNRIGDIHTIADKIREIVPEVRLQIGHGQMNEGELERVMVDFVEHRYDLLLATTIIESGLDIPNANTIFINDADHYGLSELHQLRGRVGRYKHQAYCYLMVAPHKHLTPEASKRLRAIEEFSQMGAGFAISMRDLEIRGAGNLLGTQQSGHIAAIGYELYCHLLEDAVRKAQNLPPKISAEVDIDLPIEAFLPPQYVEDLRHKIDLYRRIAKIDHADQIGEIKNELVDRFGALPPPAVRMLKIAELRLDAALWQISAITNDPRFLVLHYSDRRRIEQLAKRSPVPVRVVDEKKAYVPIHKSIEYLYPEAEESDPFAEPSGQAWLDLANAVFNGEPVAPVIKKPNAGPVLQATGNASRSGVTTARGTPTRETPKPQGKPKPLPPPPSARFRHEKKSGDKPPLASMLRGLKRSSEQPEDDAKPPEDETKR